jgi:hypothetical protein
VARSRIELLADAASARDEARRFRKAAASMGDTLIEEALNARAIELETLAAELDAQAGKLVPRKSFFAFAIFFSRSSNRARAASSPDRARPGFSSRLYRRPASKIWRRCRAGDDVRRPRRGGARQGVAAVCR